jgi:hypothetical protein
MTTPLFNPKKKKKEAGEIFDDERSSLIRGNATCPLQPYPTILLSFRLVPCDESVHGVPQVCYYVHVHTRLVLPRSLCCPY